MIRKFPIFSNNKINVEKKNFNYFYLSIFNKLKNKELIFNDY